MVIRCGEKGPTGGGEGGGTGGSRCPVASSSTSVAGSGEGETRSGMRGVKKAGENRKMMKESEWQSETGDESGGGSGAEGPEAGDSDAPEGAEGPEATVFPKSLYIVAFCSKHGRPLALRICASV